MADLPRCVKLNNPGSIEHGDPWQGLRKIQSDPKFCDFMTAPYGFRAIAMCLMTYQDRYKLDTIAKAIARWAPPDDNDTPAYIKAVSDMTKRSPDEPVNFHDYREVYPIIRAITIHEQGSFEKYFTKDQLDQGCKMAGLENTPTGVAGSVGRVIGTATVAAGTYAANDPGILTAAYNTVKPIVDAGPHVIQQGFWAVVVIAGLILVIGEIRKVKKS